MGPAIILIVEDEPIQRMQLVDLVVEAGFEAIEAADADRAVEILETRFDIRVVVTDIDMPGSMNGMRLAAVVRSRWPPIEIILMTAGLPPDPATLPERSVFLSKPLRSREVIAMLQAFAAAA